MEVWGAVGMGPLTGLHWKEGRKKKTLTARCTFKNRKGQSNIDLMGVRGADLYRVKEYEVTEELWDWCNTCHCEVRVTLAWVERKINKIEKKENNIKDVRKEGDTRVRLDRIANAKVWEQYENKCEKEWKIDKCAA